LPVAPQPPAGDPLSQTATKVVATVDYPVLNYALTTYDLQASKSSTNFDPGDSYYRHVTSQSPTNPVPVTTLTGGITYYLRSCAKSVSGNDALTVCSDPSTPNTTDIS